MNILSLQNIGHMRGTDRIIVVARMMAPVDTFTIAGVKKEPVRYDDMTRRMGITRNVKFVGRVDPIEALKDADVLINFRRRGDPWNRDILEALSMGVPVVAVGNSSPFIKQGYNGYLLRPYGHEIAVQCILMAGRLKGTFPPDNRFTGDNARQVEAIYEDLLSNQE